MMVKAEKPKKFKSSSKIESTSDKVSSSKPEKTPKKSKKLGNIENGDNEKVITEKPKKRKSEVKSTSDKVSSSKPEKTPKKSKKLDNIENGDNEKIITEKPKKRKSEVDNKEKVNSEKPKKKKIALMSEETDFIRGKPKKKEHVAPKIDDDNLFKAVDYKPDIGEDEMDDVEDETEPKKKVKKIKEDHELGKPLEELTYKKLVPGMIVLGVVTEVGEVDVVVNLPNGLTGFLNGTDISEEFNKLLAGNEEEWEEEMDICDMIQVGQYIICSVVEVVNVNKQKKVKLTAKPEIVNQHVATHNLEKHLVLQGVIQSVEDHGYIVNLGIPNTTAFLSKSKDSVYKRCDIVTVVVRSVTNSNVIVELYDNKSKTLSDKVITAFSSLLPGHLVNVTVKRQAVNGIKCSFLGGMQGALHLIHLTDLFNTKNVQEVYPLKRKVTARVILVNPATKMVLLSMLPCHVALETPGYVMAKGDILEDIEVVKVTRKGVFVDLSGGVTGFVHINKLRDEQTEKISANYKTTTKHKCRVMGFRMFDNLVQVSFRQSDLTKPFLSYQDISACAVVTATVVSVETFGLVVKLAENIRGIVPKLHLADIRIKNPALKFTPKQKVKAKVLTVDPIKRRISLTLKRSIVKNSTADITSYSEIKPKQHITGWVAAIKEFGVIMNFTNKLRGLVHVSDISNTPIDVDAIARIYKLGQVLTCRVVHVDTESEKLKLSLNLLEDLSSVGRESSNDWVRRGEIVSCTVKSSTVDGLTVLLDNSKEEAFLPAPHLTDFPNLVQPILLHYKPGHVIQQVLVINKKLKKVTVSGKTSLITWLQNHENVPKISDFSVGDFVPGYIKDFQDYGCFVEVPNGLVGLCPKACLADHFVNNPREVYKLHQTVSCKITNIDTEKERFLVSLKHCDMSPDISFSSAALMNSYLANLEVFGGVSSAEHSVGTVCEGRVKQVTEQGLLLEIGSNSGFVPSDFVDTKPAASDTAKGVVVDFDPSESFYILNLKSDFVESVVKSKKKKLQEGSVHKGSVALIKPDYFMIVLEEHGYRFGYVNKQAHINDLGKTFKDIAVNDKRKVVVKRAKKGKPVIFEFVVDNPDKGNSKADRKRKNSVSEDVKFDDIQIGKMYTVTVKNLKQMQINVQLGRKVHGRVHITEVKDCPEPGETVFSQYKCGDTLEAKLIGFRHSKTHRYLPITRTDYVRSVGEFSLRSSVIKSEKVRTYNENDKIDETKDYIERLVVGQEVTGFVRCVDSSGFIWICLTPGVQARLWYMLTSLDKEEIEAWQSRFSVGQCVKCTVFSTRDNRVDLSLVGPLAVGSKLWGLVKTTLPGIGLKLQVSARDYGVVPLTEINDHYTKDPLNKFKEDDLVQYAVVQTQEGENRLVLSTRKSRNSQRWKKSTGNRKVVNPAITSLSDVEVDKVYSGYVKKVNSESGVYVTLGVNITGRVLLKNMSDNFLKNWEPMFPVNKLVRVYVLQTEPKIELSMKKSLLVKARQQEHEESGDEQDLQKCLDDMLMEKYQENDSDDDTNVLSDSEVEDDDAPNIVFSNTQPKDTAPNGGIVSLTEALAEVEADLSDDEEEAEDNTENKENEDSSRGKSFQKREKKRLKEEQERETRRIEMKMKENICARETKDDFERLVAGNPDGSSSWVEYMAYWLGAGNVEKARETARRALSTINYRLEEEKLNVWAAFFNLENTFGTHDSLMSVCKEAAAVNDSKAVFTRLASVLHKSGKFEEMQDIYKSVLLKKYKSARKVWCTYGACLAANNKLEETRALLPRALKSLSKHKHIRTISHFAQLEYKHGDPNRGSTMFENVLNTYPARLDLWSVYLDKTIALGDNEQTRLLFDRTISLKLPYKKMKFFYRRYIAFEQAQGDQTRIELVKNKAKEFLEQSVNE